MRGVTIEDKLTFDIIWQIYQKEKQTNRLFPLQKDFYSKANKLVSNKPQNPSMESVTSVNINNIITKIKEKRQQKILLYIAYDKQIEHPIPTEEFNFYNKIIEMITKTQLPTNSNQTQNLNMLQDIPEIFLPSGNKIGPLKKSEKIQIDNKTDSKFLINNLLCEVDINLK